MSLDIYLHALRLTTVFEANITHNLTKMASEAGIYEALWHPDALDVVKAGDLIIPLEEGLRRLKLEPDFFKQFNPKNRWGDYDGLVEAVEKYLAACKANPDAEVRVRR